MICKPELFTGEMVRAIMDGRKTKTRRVCKLTPSGHVKEPGGNRRWHPADPEAVLAAPHPVGSRIWVRETWRVSSETNHYPTGEKRLYIAYRADPKHWHEGAHQRQTVFEIDKDAALAAKAWGKGRSGAWRPSIHMPRWASRITLEIEAVKVERVAGITEEDARAEGCPDDWESRGHCCRVGWFETLWDSIYAKRPGCSWADSPWVWCYTFKRVEEEQ